jgi:hypothetical protein
MIDNTLYNLMEQTVEESKSLWRIQNNYLSDAESCSECREFWERLRDDKEQHCRDLLNLMSSHFQGEKSMEEPIRR